MNRQQLEQVPIGGTFTATISEWLLLTGDVGSAEGEGVGWLEPHTFFTFIEVNEAAGTATVKRIH